MRYPFNIRATVGPAQGNVAGILMGVTQITCTLYTWGKRIIEVKVLLGYIPNCDDNYWNVTQRMNMR